jgi:hypothetical protein
MLPALKRLPYKGVDDFYLEIDRIVNFQVVYIWNVDDIPVDRFDDLVNF